jgi:2-keto-4-pentenoate hydratase/2-oxohepta-3-ene-1,7-dioic acid hydratase in catechol pathway
MKIVRMATKDGPCIGLLHEGAVYDLRDIQAAEPHLPAAAISLAPNLAELVATDGLPTLLATSLQIALSHGLAPTPYSEARLLSPIDPPIILCGGSNYSDHNKEKAESPLRGREPEFFLKSPTVVAGPRDSIFLDPLVTQKLDYEVELAVVIGKPGRNIPESKAMHHVFGYTVVNDLTARDRQVRIEPNGFAWYELAKSKNFDRSAPMGPCIVTADEIADPNNLPLRTTVNGEVRQNGSTASMIHSVASLVSHFSSCMTLHPGTVSIPGTPGGTAWASDSDLGGNRYHRDDIVRAAGYLRNGDLVVCSIEGIGALENRVELRPPA